MNNDIGAIQDLMARDASGFLGEDTEDLKVLTRVALEASIGLRHGGNEGAKDFTYHLDTILSAIECFPSVVRAYWNYCDAEKADVQISQLDETQIKLSIIAETERFFVSFQF